VSRTIGRLTALKVSRLKEPGRYADGSGLHLQISSGGARSWIYRYMLHGRAREMGLGSLSAVSLADARIKAGECRGRLQNGVDPIEARKAEWAQARAAAAKSITFANCAEAYIEAHKTGWRNPKHIQQWTNTVKTYAEPIMGDLPVSEIDTGLVLKVIEPIWKEKPETASRLRGRIESVLDWAAVRGYRQGENPARWKGHVAKLLPARSKVQAVKHHPALAYADLPAFMAQLRGQDGIAARALEFLVLAAARTGEIIGAKPDEINAKDRTWTIPPERMKARKTHRVPLSDRALAIIEKMKPLGNGDYIFPGHKKGKHLSNGAMLALLERMGRGSITPHGFRSCFRDWAAEQTSYAREVAEMSLAHTIGDKVEAAYRRGDLVEKRRRLMDAWAKYCNAPPAKTEDRVVPLRKRR